MMISLHISIRISDLTAVDRSVLARRGRAPLRMQLYPKQSVLWVAQRVLELHLESPPSSSLGCLGFRV